MTRSSLPDRTAVLLMGYGSPRDPGDLPGYLADVLGGRPPSESLIEEYRRRYDLIGWSPQLRIIGSLRTKLEARLARDGLALPVFLGTKHGTPHVAEVIPRAAEAGFRRLIAIPLSPYDSGWITSPYESAIARGRQQTDLPLEVDLRAGWHTDPDWVGYWADGIRTNLVTEATGSIVLLSAHSLPERRRKSGDPYPGLLHETARRVADAAGLSRWDFAYQSAGNTTEPWLGPDITESMLAWRERGTVDQLVAPIGFLFDHLEVLYDLDVVVRGFAEKHGIRYRRVSMPNDDDRVVETLRRVALRGTVSGGESPAQLAQR